MKESDLYVHPNEWQNHHPENAEREVQCGSVAALEYKMKFIDDKIAELECVVLGEDAARQGKMIWDKIVSLYAWYDVIEKELHKRIADYSASMQIQKSIYINAPIPPFTHHMFNTITGS